MCTAHKRKEEAFFFLPMLLYMRKRKKRGGGERPENVPLRSDYGLYLIDKRGSLFTLPGGVGEFGSPSVEACPPILQKQGGHT